MLISTGILNQTSLSGQVAIVTGAGRGIGFEAARALVWLGARVVIAEVNPSTGVTAAERIQEEFGRDSVIFVETDVGDEGSVARLKRTALDRYSQVDIVINNATLTPMGSVVELPVQAWDASYRVNLRGPVLLAKAFLPGMLERGRGVFVCVSSVGLAYMGAYECYKSAQAHLADTLDAELEGSGVFAFSIGPGLVRTPGAIAGIEELAPLYGKSVEAFFAMSEEHLISAEAAGAGFAAAVAFAEKYRGQEISSKQALLDAGIELQSTDGGSTQPLEEELVAKAVRLAQSIRTTLAEQSEGWQERPLFERQWMLRDFKKNAGMSVERWLEALEQFEAGLSARGQPQLVEPPPLARLSAYYAHMKQLAAGYEKDPQKREEQLAIIDGWKGEVDQLIAILAWKG